MKWQPPLNYTILLWLSTFLTPFSEASGGLFGKALAFPSINECDIRNEKVCGE